MTLKLPEMDENQSSKPRQYYSVPEAADLLGWTEDQVWEALETGKLVAIAPAHWGNPEVFAYRFAPPEVVLAIRAAGTDVVTWLDRGPVGPARFPAQPANIRLLAEYVDSLRGELLHSWRHESTAPFASLATRTNKLKSRTNSLDPVINMAKERATDPSSYHSVWDALVALANSPNPPSPLLGCTADGIQYRGKRFHDEDVGADYFTKGALRKRMNPKAR